MAFAGIRGTGNWGTDERPKDFRETILWLNPNGAAPFTALSSKMAKAESLTDAEFSWWEETLGLVRLQVNGALTNVATALVIDNSGLDCVVGDILMVETAAGSQSSSYANEFIEVTAVNSDTSLTIARGVAGSAAAAISDNALLLKIGSAFAEGTASPEATSRNPTKLNNYAQITKTAYEITNTADKTKARTGPAMKNDKKRRSYDHSRDIELTAFFGKRHETTAGGQPKRYTGGLYFFLAAASRVNVRSAGYANIDAMADDLYDCFDYSGSDQTGGDERIVYCGNGALNVVNRLVTAAGTVNFGEVVKLYGQRFTKLELPQGTFLFKSHPLMNIHSLYSNTFFVVDPPGCRWRYLRDTNAQDDIQNNDEDTKKGQWLTEGGWEFNHMRTFRMITNITKA
jgi:hypothetical protein